MIHGKIKDDLNRLKRMENKAGRGILPNTWDAENRLVSCESTAAVPQAAKAKERWTYYADGRWKERITYTNNSGNWVSTTTNRFVWDGKVIMAILDHTNGLKQSFVHGLDMGGTEQGAGGTGGLLIFNDNASTQSAFYCFDGNGNVTSLASTTNASVILASYYCRGDVQINFGLKVGIRAGIDVAYIEGGDFFGGQYSYRRGEFRVVGFVYGTGVIEVKMSSVFSYTRRFEYRYGTSFDM